MKIIVLFCCCLSIVVKCALADGNDQFMDDINQYRLASSLPKFTSNSGATCVAQQVALQYKGIACSNSTGTATVSGLEPQLDETLLNKCNLQLVNVKDGFMGPTCVPAGTWAPNAPTVAANSIITSPAYTEALNDTKYVSAGAGSVDNAWFVLVLGTNSSEGSYQNQDLDPSEDNSAVGLHSGWGGVAVVASLVAYFLLA